ncbi:MAG: hypothetical protein A2Z95_05535 [Gallionellales bacterium GWA2_60_18]|nr:MAG: hypothetical protein A2Z95_05535 [Gallionellales bacterium GWA2_60_18]
MGNAQRDQELFPQHFAGMDVAQILFCSACGYGFTHNKERTGLFGQLTRFFGGAQQCLRCLLQVGVI